MAVAGAREGWLTSLSISHLRILGKFRVCLLAYNIVNEFPKRLFLLVRFGDDG